MTENEVLLCDVGTAEIFFTAIITTHLRDFPTKRQTNEVCEERFNREFHQMKKKPKKFNVVALRNAVGSCLADMQSFRYGVSA